MRDYYEILGVKKTATLKAIEAAYRKKSMKAHPDQGGSIEEFKELNEAAEVLRDKSQRAYYDQHGCRMASDSLVEQLFRSLVADAFIQNQLAPTVWMRLQIDQKVKGAKKVEGDAMQRLSSLSKALESFEKRNAAATKSRGYVLVTESLRSAMADLERVVRNQREEAAKFSRMLTLLEGITSDGKSVYQVGTLTSYFATVTS